MKREIILFSGAAAIFAAPECLADNPRPNILWLTFEDTSAEFIGCYGNEDAKTPNMDALAQSGVRFGSAFSSGAVSSASRFCLITGVGAFTAGNGAHRSSYPVPDGWEGFPYYLRQAGYYTSNNKKTDYNLADAEEFTGRAWDECSGKADWRGRKDGQPFFAVYNSMSSHQSRTMTDTWESYERLVLDNLEEDEKTGWGNLEMPPFYRNSGEMQKNLSRVYNSITKTDKEFGEWLRKLDEDGLRDSTIIFCFSDHGEGIPRGKCSPLSMGYRVPFIVWIPPMYSELSPFGSGVVTDRNVSFEDIAPTILSLAGVPVPEYMEGVPFMGRNPGPARKYVFSGLDRTDENTEMSRSVTDGTYMYTRCFMPYQPLVRWMMYWDSGDIMKQMRKDFKDGKLNGIQESVLKPREWEYLYNIREDKWETVNLVSDRKYREKLEELRNVLEEHLVDSRDAGFIPEHIIRKYAQQGIPPYELRLDEDVLPVRETVSMLFPSGKGKKDIRRIIDGLYSSNRIVQYWAAVTVFSYGGKCKAYSDEIAEAVGQVEDNIAKSYLYACLAEYCGRDEFFGRFLDGIGNPNKELERTTMQLLMNMDESYIRKALPAVESRLSGKKVPGPVKEWCRLILYRMCKRGLDGIESNF